jgi:hypothetical protein
MYSSWRNNSVELASGGKEEDFQCRIHKGLLNHLIMPSSRLLFFLDPKRTRKLVDVYAALQPCLEDFRMFCDQHLESNKETVDSWTWEHYLDVMESFHVITRIRNKDECWGALHTPRPTEGVSRNASLYSLGLTGANRKKN